MTAAATPEVAVTTATDHEKTLQVPLAGTVHQRAKLADAIRAQSNFNLRELYAEYIDVVGANGIIAALEEVDPACHDRGHDLGKVIYSLTG
ncbi:MAG: hypothetical protein ACR2QG_09460, partial [Gammaproteobacteria bacterium]